MANGCQFVGTTLPLFTMLTNTMLWSCLVLGGVSSNIPNRIRKSAPAEVKEAVSNNLVLVII